MRISDWSSDGCSSDLGGGPDRARTAGTAAGSAARRAPGLPVAGQLPAGALRGCGHGVRAAAGGRRWVPRHAPAATAGRWAADHNRDSGAERRGGLHVACRGGADMTTIKFDDREGPLTEG